MVSGPSGSGKNRVISEVMKVTHGLNYSVSATTRQKRPGERNGVNYHFVSLDEVPGHDKARRSSLVCRSLWQLLRHSKEAR